MGELIVNFTVLGTMSMTVEAVDQDDARRQVREILSQGIDLGRSEIVIESFELPIELQTEETR